MSHASKQQSLVQFATALGPVLFNELVSSVAYTREKGRLRFWQEQLLEKVAAESATSVLGWAEFLELFEGAARESIPHEPWTRELFLKEIEKFPWGGFPLNETPSDWMAEAWGNDSVREELSDSFARHVSKTGSLCYPREYLKYLSDALSVHQAVELFLYIRDRCSTRESEFRPEFEQAFPRCVSSLPPPLPEVQREQHELESHFNQGSTPCDGEIPF
jgi:hypothetical protein